MRYFFSIASLSILLSCSGRSDWSFDQIHAGLEASSSTKLTYVSDDPVNGLDVEFIQTADHLKVYINIHSTPIPASKSNPKNATVVLTLEGAAKRCDAYRLEGGQRFLLSDEGTKTLIEALESGKKVIVSLAGYRSTLTAGDFPTKFNRLQHPFPVQNPFKLPF